MSMPCRWLCLLLAGCTTALVPHPVGQHKAIRSSKPLRAGPERKTEYYKGMISSSFKEEDASKDMLTPTLKLAGGTTVVLAVLLGLFVAANPDVASAAEPASFEPRGIVATDVVVFLIGTVPFLWAANEFWRRIAVGASFGTGSDSVVFDTQGDADEDQLRRFGGRRVLGQDAIIAARTLMAVAAGSVLLAGVAALPFLNV